MEMSDPQGDVKELWCLWETLRADVAQALNDAKQHGSQYHRRMYVRAVFAAVEAAVFLMKKEVLGRPDIGRYGIEELALLREESYALNSKGEAFAQPKFLP